MNRLRLWTAATLLIILMVSVVWRQWSPSAASAEPSGDVSLAASGDDISAECQGVRYPETHQPLAFAWNEPTAETGPSVASVSHARAGFAEEVLPAGESIKTQPATELAAPSMDDTVLASHGVAWAAPPIPPEEMAMDGGTFHGAMGVDGHPANCSSPNFPANTPAACPDNLTPCRNCGCRSCRGCNAVTQAMARGGPRVKNFALASDCGVRRPITGVDSATCVGSGEPDWGMRGPIPWEFFAQGEYVGPSRSRHVDKYRLRVDDELQFVYRVTRERSPDAYELNIGDEIRVEAVADKDLDRQLVIQPDGTVTLRLLGQVIAAGRTTDELRRDLEKRYTAFYEEPAITVTPIIVNTQLNDLRATVDSRAGNGGQSFTTVVIPDGTVQLPAVGSVPAHGLTLDELKMELDARYKMVVDGIEVTPVLRQRAARAIYVVGEVTTPGRYDLTGPTTVTQAIALAQGWRNGANLRNIVIFRRAEDWRLLATKIDIQGALYGRRPAPSDEIWLRDSDVVIVPKAPIKVLNDAIELLFTNGIYGVMPFLSDSIIFTDASNL